MLNKVKSRYSSGRTSKTTLAEKFVMVLIILSVIMGVLTFKLYSQPKESLYVSTDKKTPASSPDVKIETKDGITTADLTNPALKEIPDNIYSNDEIQILKLGENITQISTDIRKLQNLNVLSISSDCSIPSEISLLFHLKEIYLPYELWWYKVDEVKNLTRAKIILY